MSLTPCAVACWLCLIVTWRKPVQVLFVGFLLLLPGIGLDAADRPNILIMLADDMGNADAGFQGCLDIPTPHLDRLAADAMVFSAGYVTHSYCSPSRAALLTGRYQQRFGHEKNPEWLPDAVNVGIDLREILLPEMLRDAGYTTAAFGKWHLGAAAPFHPMDHGFDFFFGFLHGSSPYFPPPGGRLEPLQRNRTTVVHSKYMTEMIADEVVSYIHDKGPEQPWFAYVAFNAPHRPMEAPAKWEEYFAHIADPLRRTYAGMVSEMDVAIGRILDALTEEGVSENTMVIFLSDNGGSTLNPLNGASNGIYRGSKGQLFDGGVRVPFVIRWPGSDSVGAGRFEPFVSALDIVPTVLATAGAQAPGDREYDGVDLRPFVEDGTAPHEYLFWRQHGPEGVYGVRWGNWKAISWYGGYPNLFDLENDPGEITNLSLVRRDVVAQMWSAMRVWEQSLVLPRWFEAADVLPAPKPNEARSPFLGYPHPLPGLVQAEHFDRGGPGVGFLDHDTKVWSGNASIRGDSDVELRAIDEHGNHAVAFAWGGEWLLYSIAPEPGIYDAALRVASRLPVIGDLSLEFGDLKRTVHLRGTGSFDQWETVLIRNIDLTGQTSCKVTFLGAETHLDAIEFFPAGVIGTRYGAWLETNVGSEALARLDLASVADADFDGVPNFVEFLAGSDLFDSNSRPVVAWQWSPDASHGSVNVSLRDAACSAFLRLQASGDLVNWTNGLLEPAVSEVEGRWDATWQINSSSGIPATAFYRLAFEAEE